MRSLDRQLSLEWESFTLEIIVDRLKREFKVEAEVWSSTVAYWETIELRNQSISIG